MKNRIGLSFFLILTALLARGTLGEADELQSPKEFYEKGFVNENKGSSSSSALSVNPPRAAQGEEGETAEENSSTGHIERFGEREGSFSSQTSESSSISSSGVEAEEPASEVGGSKVISIALVLNSKDPKHFKKYYEEAQEITEKYQIPFSDVFVVGDAKKLLASQEFKSLKRTPQSGNFRYVRKLPKELSDIKKSPAMLIELESGVVILEGFPSLKKAFNSQGQFVEPQHVSH